MRFDPLLLDLVIKSGLESGQEKIGKNHARLHSEQNSPSLIHTETTGSLDTHIQGHTDTRTYTCVNQLADDKILDRSKLKQSADDNFKFDENSRKFSKRVENTVGKGEIARYSVFKWLVSKGCQKVSLCRNG